MMKILHIIILCNLFVLVSVQGQSENTGNIEKKNNRNKNLILPELLTDKTLYQAGEKIRFSAFLYDHRSQSLPDTTAILFVGLYNDKGEEVFSGKYEVRSGRTYGDIRLPIDLQTAFYRIIAGTTLSFPGNQPLSVLEIPVINIFKPEESDIFEDSDTGQYLFAHTTIADSIVHIKNAVMQNEDLLILSCKAFYKPRENSMLTIRTAESGNPKNLNFMTMTVTDSICGFAPNYKYLLFSDETIETAYLFFPPISEFPDILNNNPAVGEANTVLSSKMNSIVDQDLASNSIHIDVSSSEQESEKVLMISTPDNASWLRTYWFSGENRTEIELPCVSGDYPMVFQVFRNGQPLQFDIDINQKSANWKIPSRERSVKDKYELGGLTESVRKSAEFKATYGITDKDAFSANTSIEKNDNILVPAFYAPSDIIFNVADYEFSGKLGEFIDLYVTPIKMKKKKGKVEIRFGMLYKANLNSAGNVFLMLNGVPVTDASLLLDLSTDLVKSIEIRMNPFLYQNYLFGGIVSIFTYEVVHTSDYIPDESVVMEIKGFTPKKIKYPLKQTYDENSDNQLPDLRNLLYWHPDMVLDRPLSPEFTAPEMAGSYFIVLRGFIDGKRVNKIEKIIIDGSH